MCQALISGIFIEPTISSSDFYYDILPLRILMIPLPYLWWINLLCACAGMKTECSRCQCRCAEVAILLQMGTINNALPSAEAQKCQSGVPTHESSPTALIHVSCYTTASCGFCCFLGKWAPLSRQVYITSLMCNAWGSRKPNGCFCTELFLLSSIIKHAWTEHTLNHTGPHAYPQAVILATSQVKF